MTIHLIECRLGKVRYFAERDAAEADLETTIRDLMSGEIDNPLRVLACDPDEGWCLDVSEDIAHEVAARTSSMYGVEWRDNLGRGTLAFLERHGVAMPVYAMQAAE